MAEEGPERRARLSQEIRDRTGIDEAMIETLVRTFYARVRADALIGPIFEAKVRDWDHHLGKLCDFWSSVVLMTGRYHGQPMQAHAPLPVGREHFDRWLALFEETAKAICPPQAAAIFVERAQRIADSFELGLAARRGEIATPHFSQRGGTVRVVPPAMRDRA